jgi:hypothetical protein
VTSDFQITEKPDPRCIVSTHEPAEIPVSFVFPNPAGDHISIVSGSTVHRYSISDGSSRLVLSGRPLAKEFDVAIDLVPGMYMIVLETESGTSSLKLLIVR